MPHEVFVRDVVAVERKVLLPDHCPKCKVEFGPGSKNVKLWSLKPIFHQVRLTKVMANGKETEVFETVSAPQIPVGDGDWDRLPAIFKCANCHHTLAKYHRRTWVLEALDPYMAAKLQTLLYDDNVRDLVVNEKVWGRMQRRVGCVACAMEAEIGTEEVPHPIDLRVHTCEKVLVDELDKKR